MGKAKEVKPVKPAKPDKAVKEVKPTKVVVEKLTQNGLTRPSEGTRTREIWDISDQISQESGEPAGRKEVVAECLRREINESTAATQYARWRKFHGIKAPVSVAKAAATVEADDEVEAEEEAVEAEEEA